MFFLLLFNYIVFYDKILTFVIYLLQKSYLGISWRCKNLYSDWCIRIKFGSFCAWKCLSVTLFTLLSLFVSVGWSSQCCFGPFIGYGFSFGEYGLWHNRQLMPGVMTNTWGETAMESLFSVSWRKYWLIFDTSMWCQWKRTPLPICSI